MNKKRFLVVLFCAAMMLGFVSFTLNAPRAHANFLGDFFRGLLTPFSGGSVASPTSPVSQDVPLYKPAVDYEDAVIAAVKKASPAVVSITISKNVPNIENCASNPFSDLPPQFRQFFGGDLPQFYTPCQKGSSLQEVGSGSGFIVSSDGLILTNKHVVEDTEASYTVFTNDGKKYSAKVLARDPVQDLALVKIEASGLTSVELGDSDNIQLGQSAIAIGNALGEFRNTVSVGVISGLARTVTASGGDSEETIQGVLQTDAAINPGNSGGPLLNLRGEVIGINTAVASDAQNIGFAIPINRAKRDIQSVKTSGEIQIPYLGVRFLMLSPDNAKDQHVSVDYGALVRGTSDGPAVEAGSPAAKAGIQAEDIILEVNGKKIDKDHSLVDIISEFQIGDTVTLTVNRDGKEITLQATLTKRPN